MELIQKLHLVALEKNFNWVPKVTQDCIGLLYFALRLFYSVFSKRNWKIKIKKKIKKKTDDNQT